MAGRFTPSFLPLSDRTGVRSGRGRKAGATIQLHEELRTASSRWYVDLTEASHGPVTDFTGRMLWAAIESAAAAVQPSLL